MISRTYQRRRNAHPLSKVRSGRSDWPRVAARPRRGRAPTAPLWLDLARARPRAHELLLPELDRARPRARGLLRPELAHVRPRDRGLLPPATLPLFRSVSAAPTVVLAPQRVCLPLLLCALKQPHRRSAPVVRRRSSYRSRGASIFLRRSQALPWRRPTSRSHGATICR